jgi:cell volume regulation protein A
LARRDGQLRSFPKQLQGGDLVYLMVAPQQVPLLDKLFGHTPDLDAAEEGLYGDFIIAPEVTVRALRLAYGLPLDAALDDKRAFELFAEEFRNDIEIGDRLRLGPVELIVRELDENGISSIGLSLDPEGKPLQGWEKFLEKVTAALGLKG